MTMHQHQVLRTHLSQRKGKQILGSNELDLEENTSTFEATLATTKSCCSTWKEETCNSDSKATLDTEDTERYNVANENSYPLPGC